MCNAILFNKIKELISKLEEPQDCVSITAMAGFRTAIIKELRILLDIGKAEEAIKYDYPGTEDK